MLYQQFFSYMTEAEKQVFFFLQKIHFMKSINENDNKDQDNNKYKIANYYSD